MKTHELHEAELTCCTLQMKDYCTCIWGLHVPLIKNNADSMICHLVSRVSVHSGYFFFCAILILWNQTNRGYSVTHKGQQIDCKIWIWEDSFFFKINHYWEVLTSNDIAISRTFKINLSFTLPLDFILTYPIYRIIRSFDTSRFRLSQKKLCDSKTKRFTRRKITYFIILKQTLSNTRFAVIKE